MKSQAIWMTSIGWRSKIFHQHCNFIISKNEISHAIFKKIHQLVGSNLIPNCWEYRTKKMMASGSNVIYSMPYTIGDERMVELFQFIHKHLHSIPLELDSRLGSFFFYEFLLIHPLSNGNGKTARLLLTAFLTLVFDVYWWKRRLHCCAWEKEWS